MVAQFAGMSTAGPTVGATTYVPIAGISGFNATESTRAQVIPGSTTVRKLRVKVNTAPGAGKNLVFTVERNGADTGITLTISGSATSAQDLTHSQAFSAGDTISLKCVADAGATISQTWWTVEQDSGATSQYCVLGGCAGAVSATTYLPLNGKSNANTTETNVEAPIAHGGTIKSLYVLAETAPGAGAGWTCKARKNGADAGLSVSLAGAGSGNGITTGNDTTNTASVVAGDRLAFTVVVASGAPAASRFAMSFLVAPTTDGQSTIFSSDANAISNNASKQYNHAAGGHPNLGFITTELTRQVMVSKGTLKAMYIRGPGGPGGGGKSYTATQRTNGADTALTLSMNAAGAADYNITGQTVTTNDDDLIAMGYDSVGSPFGTAVQIGFLFVKDTGSVDSTQVAPAAAATAAAVAPTLSIQSTGMIDITVRL